VTPHARARGNRGFERARQRLAGHVSGRLVGTPLGARPWDPPDVDPGLAEGPRPVPPPPWLADRAGDVVHPRVAERIDDVEARARRRRRWLWGSAGTLCLLVAGSVLAVQSALLDVDEVVVEGASHYDVAAISRTGRVSLGDPLLFVDLDGIARRVERLPWVADASVSRTLSGRVRIVVEERTPVAWIRRPDATMALLDATGFLIEDVPAPPVGLPEVRTTALVPPSGQDFAITRGGAEVAAAWDLVGRGGLRDVGLDRADLRIGLVDGTTVRFGRAEEVPAKLAALRAVLAHLGDRPVRYIDLSVPSAPAVSVEELVDPPPA
jgi:cell division protein FtsQ